MTKEETVKGLKTMVKDKWLWRSNRYYAMVCKNALDILRKERRTMTKQIRFRDLENGMVHGGILLDDGSIVCGCCGGLLEKEDEGKTWVTLYVYHNWVSLDEEICGDDLIG